MKTLRQRLECRDAGAAIIRRACRFEVRETSADGTVEGYGSVFNVTDSYDDVVAPGAFLASIKAHKAAGTMPAMLWQHEGDEPIGVWDDCTEDGKGLKVRGRLALDTARGKEAQALLKMGAINGLSIGFMSKEWSYSEETDIRTLTEIDLWEVSLVTFPANPKARITSVKSADVAAITTIRQAEKALRDAGFSDDAAVAFIARLKRIVIDERDAQDAAKRINQTAERLITQLKGH
jgi:HK97 family phage prohead protease